MFNSLNWQKLVSETYDLKFQQYEFKNKILFLTEQKRNNKSYYFSPPFGDYIDIDILTIDFLNNFQKTLSNLNYQIKFTSNINQNINFKKSGYIHEIVFESYEDWYNNKIRSKFRNKIHQTKKHDLKFKIGNEIIDLENFYSLHANLRVKKFKQIPQPWIFFKNLYKFFFIKNNSFVITAYYKSKIISSVVCIIDQDIAYYKFAASNLDLVNLRPNNYLLSELIRYLDSLNIKKLNLGYTGSSIAYEGLRRFKTNSGANEYPRLILKNYDDEKGFINFKLKIQNEIYSKISSKFTQKDIQYLSNKYYKYFL